MSEEQLKGLITTISVGIALIALTWNVTSWRLAGPSLRFHCFWYREVLVIRVFNAGRTADTVEQMDLGTRPRDGLTKMLKLPLRVEPGQAKEWRIGADHLTDQRREALAGGWAPLWTLSGSMKERRSDIVPVDADAPSEEGWHLVPRRARWWRYIPLAASLFAYLTREPNWAAAITAMSLGAMVLWAISRVTWMKRATYNRARVQRRITLTSLVVAAGGGLVTAHKAGTPVWLTVCQLAVIGAALVVANAQAGEAWLEYKRGIWRRLSALMKLCPGSNEEVDPDVPVV